MTSIYVGNLSWGVGTNDLRDLFSEYGTISDAIVLEDRETGRSRGFGFVEMDNAQEAIDAVPEPKTSELTEIEKNWQIMYRHGFWRGGVVMGSASDWKHMRSGVEVLDDLGRMLRRFDVARDRG